MTSLLKTLLLSASIALAGTAVHAESTAPIRLIIGFPPGGALDNLARSLAEDLRTTLKEPVLVENRPGASSRISIEAVKTARPDGRTILIGATPAFVLFPMTYARLNYDVDKDFIPVAHLANVPSVVSAGADQPFKTIPEYVAWIKKHPANASVGMTNLGGGLHFSVLQLSKAIGVPLTPVTYRGGAPLATDLIGDHVPIGTDALASQLELHCRDQAIELAARRSNDQGVGLRRFRSRQRLVCCVRASGDAEGGGREAGDGPSRRHPQPASARTG